MSAKFIDLGCAIFAGMFVMILHELPKTIVYYMSEKKESRSSLLYALKFQHYIDPIGLILSIVAYSGFSKPYMYRIKNKKMNLKLGITGFVSLVITFIISSLILKYYFGIEFGEGGFYYLYKADLIRKTVMMFFFNVAFMSCGMFLVNLFPIATFDMGNIIAGISPVKFYEYLCKDYVMKLIFILIVIFGVIQEMAQIVLSSLL